MNDVETGRGVVKTFWYKSRKYVAYLEKGILIHVAKEGQVWESGEIFECAEKKVKERTI